MALTSPGMFSGLTSLTYMWLIPSCDAKYLIGFRIGSVACAVIYNYLVPITILHFCLCFYTNAHSVIVYSDLELNVISTVYNGSFDGLTALKCLSVKL